MVIRIKYRDGRYDMVKASHLNRLIAANLISQFKRSSGWAIIGRDPIRGRGKNDCFGPDKRLQSGPPDKGRVPQEQTETWDR